MVGLSMGQTAEELATEFGISREQMDAFAVQSHQRLAHARDAGWLDEIEPLYDTKGNVYEHDDGLREDASLEKLAKLKPVFDRPIGRVTAGNRRCRRLTAGFGTGRPATQSAGARTYHG